MKFRAVVRSATFPPMTFRTVSISFTNVSLILAAAATSHERRRACERTDRTLQDQRWTWIIIHAPLDHGHRRLGPVRTLILDSKRESASVGTFVDDSNWTLAKDLPRYRRRGNMPCFTCRKVTSSNLSSHQKCNRKTSIPSYLFFFFFFSPDTIIPKKFFRV